MTIQCPKCEWMDIVVQYVRYGFREREELKCKCRRCEYEWYRECADAAILDTPAETEGEA